MTIHEQIDSFTFEIQEAVDRADLKLGKMDDEEEFDIILEAMVKDMNQLIYRYNHEFDLSTYQIVGAIEFLKYDYTLSGVISSDMLGVLEMVKLSIIERCDISFECELDDDDDDNIT
jgi:hypothetical protein